MSLEPLTPENTTVVMIDFGLGFANVFRSHSLRLHQNNALQLADLALRFKAGLVVTNGPAHKASGPYYPELLKLLGDHPIIERGGMFIAFLLDGFKEAVAATGRKNVAVAGLVTEGCVLQTVLGGLREGYNMHVVADACAAQTSEIHEVALKRMTMAGAVPITSFSLAAEFTVDQSGPAGKPFYDLTSKYQPELSVLGELFEWAQTDALATQKS